MSKTLRKDGEIFVGSSNRIIFDTSIEAWHGENPI